MFRGCLLFSSTASYWSEVVTPHGLYFYSLMANDAVHSSCVYQMLICLPLWTVYSDLLFTFNWVVCLFIVEKWRWFTYPEERWLPRSMFWQYFLLISDLLIHLSHLPFPKWRSFRWTRIIFSLLWPYKICAHVSRKLCDFSSCIYIWTHLEMMLG